MVEITQGWSYGKDQYNYILYHTYEKDIYNVRTKETRRGEVTEVVGYFQPNLYGMDKMLKKIAHEEANNKIIAGEITTIQEHIAEIERSYKLLYPNLGGDGNGEADM